MKDIDPKNEIIFIEVDWKKELSDEDKKTLEEHAKSVEGTWKRLRVDTVDAKVYFAGSDIFNDWVGSYACAFEMFIALEVKMDDEGNILEEVINWYYVPEEHDVFVRVRNANNHDDVRIISYDQWESELGREEDYTL